MPREQNGCNEIESRDRRINLLETNNRIKLSTISCLDLWMFMWEIIFVGKARRLKQAKEEAQDEIEKYRKERERQFREFEAKHMGSREDVAAKIEQDTMIRIAEMNKAVISQKEPVIGEILQLVYNIKPEMHKNYRV